MKHLLASTAIVLAGATATFAETHAASPFAEGPMGEVLYASDLVGARLYVSESESGELEERAEWDDVGEIHDIVVGKDGKVQNVLADIGGFLGIGEKRIAVSMDSLEFVSDGEGATEYFIVLSGSREALENAPVYDRDMMDDGMAEMNEAAEEVEQTAEAAGDEITEEAAEMEQTAEAAGDEITEEAAEMEQTADATMDRPMFTPPMIEREGYETAKLSDLTTEDVTGARVFDAKDEWIGEVNSLVLADDGQLQEAIIDVGGFLGLGEKQVALSMEELTIKRSEEGVRIYLDATEEQLEKMPEWQG